jgi:L-cysteate sulfo-lyase
VIPGGGSNGTGALGYARAALELITEAPFTLTDVVHATSSAGTQAGLLLGFACANSSVRVHGINVYTPDRDSVAANVARICSEADPALVPAPNNVLIDQRYLGDGYGLPTPATLDAIRMVAELEGVLLDPVYSGKAMSGLIDRIAIGDLHDVENVVFVHTGGTAVLAVYDGAFTAPRAMSGVRHPGSRLGLDSHKPRLEASTGQPRESPRLDSHAGKQVWTATPGRIREGSRPDPVG